jgi:DNA-binding ferritin-like protein
MGILMVSFGELIGAAFFAGLAVLAVIYIAWQSYHYRVRGPHW